jgi:hypothetical protein
MSDGAIHTISPFMLQESTSTSRSLTPVALDLIFLVDKLWLKSTYFTNIFHSSA